MNSIKDIFKINIPGHGRPFRGSLLVAEPFLHEPYFDHAVIAMIDCEPGSQAMGVVLNLPTHYTLDKLIDGVSVPVPVFCGGPMSSDRLFYLHTLGDIFPGAREICPGLFVGGNIDSVTSYVETGYPIDGNIRFFIGYSGWDIGQLEGELDRHVWAVTSAPEPLSAMLSGSDDHFWHKTVRSMGAPFKPWLYHPRNPGNN